MRCFWCLHVGKICEKKGSESALLLYRKTAFILSSDFIESKKNTVYLKLINCVHVLALFCRCKTLWRYLGVCVFCAILRYFGTF